MQAADTSRTSSTTQTCRSRPGATGRLKIIQKQVGHQHASTTSIYTCVSSDFRTRTLRTALDSTINAALAGSSTPPARASSAMPNPSSPTEQAEPDQTRST